MTQEISKKAAIFIHRLYFDGVIKKGGLDQIIDFMLQDNFELTLFEFPLDYTIDKRVKISKVTSKKSIVLKEFNMPNIYAQANWILEIFVNLFLSFKYLKNVDHVFTSDPLTTVPAIILRKLNKIKYVYYHAVDYSTDRFRNIFMNYFYLVLLKFGLKNADLVGVVTKPAKERLAQFRRTEIIFIPNSLDFKSVSQYRKPINEKIPYSLVVTCSDVSHKYLIHKIVELTKILKKDFPDILLSVLGYFDPTNDYCVKLTNYVKENNLDDNVVFCGSVERSTNYQIIGKSMIGLAYYDGNFSHVIFGDALKIREYCALGLAVVSDDSTHTATEMEEANAGYIANDFEGAADKVKQLFSDSNLYKTTVENALLLAQKNDKHTIVQLLLEKIFN